MIKHLKFEPAVVLYAANAIVALLVAWGLNLSPDQTGAIATITTAAVTIYTAATTRPVVIPTITGAAATAAAAFAAFHLELSADQISTAVTAGSIVLALLLRQAVTPAATVRAPLAAPRM